MQNGMVKLMVYMSRIMDVRVLQAGLSQNMNSRDNYTAVKLWLARVRALFAH